MSSMLQFLHPGNLSASARGRKLVDFLIRSTPALSLAFLSYVTFRDYL